jgi:hypothetical protein
MLCESMLCSNIYLLVLTIVQQEELRSDPSVQYLSNGSHAQNLRSTSGHPQVKLSLLRSISLKIRPQERGVGVCASPSPFLYSGLAHVQRFNDDFSVHFPPVTNPKFLLSLNVYIFFHHSS